MARGCSESGSLSRGKEREEVVPNRDLNNPDKLVKATKELNPVAHLVELDADGLVHAFGVLCFIAELLRKRVVIQIVWSITALFFTINARLRRTCSLDHIEIIVFRLSDHFLEVLGSKRLEKRFGEFSNDCKRHEVHHRLELTQTRQDDDEVDNFNHKDAYSLQQADQVGNKRTVKSIRMRKRELHVVQPAV